MGESTMCSISPGAMRWREKWASSFPLSSVTRMVLLPSTWPTRKKMSACAALWWSYWGTV